MSAKNTVLTKVVGGAAGVIVAVVAYVVAYNGVRMLSGGRSVERQIEKLASDMNKQLPMQVDEMTRLDRVEPGPGKTYSYIYTISKDLTDQEKQAVQESTTRRALAAPEMQTIFSAGVTVWYKYHDAAGKKLLEFSVKK